MLNKIICIFIFGFSVAAQAHIQQGFFFDDFPNNYQIEKIQELKKLDFLLIQMKHLPDTVTYSKMSPFYQISEFELTDGYPTGYEVNIINQYPSPYKLTVYSTPASPYEVQNLNAIKNLKELNIVSTKYHSLYEAEAHNTLKMKSKIIYTNPLYPNEEQIEELKPLTNTTLVFENEVLPGFDQIYLLNQLQSKIQFSIINYYPAATHLKNLRLVKKLSGITIKQNRFPSAKEVENLNTLKTPTELILESVFCQMSSEKIQILNGIENLSGITFSGDSCFSDNVLEITKEIKAPVVFLREGARL